MARMAGNRNVLTNHKTSSYKTHKSDYWTGSPAAELTAVTEWSRRERTAISNACLPDHFLQRANTLKHKEAPSHTDNGHAPPSRSAEVNALPKRV